MSTSPKSDSEIYKTFKPSYYNIIKQDEEKGPTILAQGNYKREEKASVINKSGPVGPHNSDVLFAQFKETGISQPLRKLKRVGVSNKESQAVIQYIFQEEGIKMDAGNFCSFKTSSSGDELDNFCALLGTPNGKAAAHLVIDNGRALRIRGIESASIKVDDAQDWVIKFLFIAAS